MKQYLTFKDDKSDKFWQIVTSEKSFTVTFGKTGTAGVSQVKKFASERMCLEEAEKLVFKKLKSGYSKTFSATKKSVQKPSESRNKTKTFQWAKVECKSNLLNIPDICCVDLYNDVIILSQFTQKRENRLSFWNAKER
jgi:predicted DNA-binding WGR domain protein